MIEIPVDFPSLPAVGALLPGDSLHFQYSYRDGTDSNFSSALKVYFN